MIALGWVGGRAHLVVGGSTISLSQVDAATLAQDLTDGNKPACTGYPMPADATIGGYVITAITRVANESTIVEFGRVASHTPDHDLDPYEYSGSWRVTLAPAELGVLVDQLRNGGAQ